MKSYLGLLAMMLSAQVSWGEIKTVPYVDLGQYAGIWYQIARKPVIFESGCVCSRQVLTPLENGEIGVYNSCNNNTPKGPLRDIEGVATNVDKETNAKFIVDFGLANKGDYWIIALGENYEYAVVTDPREISLYVLSKTPELSEALYQEAIDSVRDQVNVSRLVKTRQAGCEYPDRS